MAPPFGISDAARDWAEPHFHDDAWPAMQLPTAWQTAGHEGSGVLWFRREVDLPEAWAGRELTLGIGAVDKTDITFFNGEQVGATGRGFDQSVWNVPRPTLRSITRPAGDTHSFLPRIDATISPFSPMVADASRSR